MVVIVLGLPGSGKSYFAEELARHINAVYICSDRVRKETVTNRNYSDKEKRSVYNEMLKHMKILLKENRNLVIDATFYKRELREKFINGAADSNTVFFIEIRADKDLTDKRLKRKRLFSEADSAVFEKIKEQWEPLKQYHLVLESTDNDLSGMIQKAVSYLHINNDQ